MSQLPLGPLLHTGLHNLLFAIHLCRLFVQVYGALETLDHVVQSEASEVPESLRHRVSTGLKDAEAKNEALWKLYVFLSDGLFYTGVLAKLLQNHECSVRAENHKKHLEMAQNIALRALRCAWKDWEGIRRDPKVQIETVLAEGMNIQSFGRLLLLFSNGEYEFREYDRRVLADVSAVEVGQYLHGDSLENCRDIRYKFDRHKSLAAILESSTISEERKQLIPEVIRASGRSLDDFSNEELDEVVARLGTTTLDLGDALRKVAARGEALLDPEFLKEVWREDMASLRKS